MRRTFNRTSSKNWLPSKNRLPATKPLQVNFQTLPDGTNYPASETLDAPAKKVGVQVQNANYQKASQ
jgi:hypothetical protein